MAQIPPPGSQFTQFNTHHMVFELQGSVGELKQLLYLSKKQSIGVLMPSIKRPMRTKPLSIVSNE
jgi:hypothetical protein